MSDPVRVPDSFQYLRPAQVAELEQEATSIDKRLQQPAMGADKGEMQKRRRSIQKMLDTQQSPELTPEQRDVWKREEKRLEEEFAPGMLSAEAMRKNPPGAVDRNLAWHRKYAKAVARWKNIRRALHRGDDSPDVANIERLRRHRTPQDLPMDGAQIPGTSYFGTHPSEAYKEGHDRTFGAQTPTGPEPRRSIQPGKVAALCGKETDPRGIHSHERACPRCAEIRAERNDHSA